MTVDRRFVKPREGYKVRDPYTKEIIPAEGALVVTSGGYGTTIQKGINSGDLIECEPPAEEAFEQEPQEEPRLFAGDDLEKLEVEIPRTALRRRATTRTEAAVDQRHAEGVSHEVPSSNGEGEVR